MIRILSILVVASTVAAQTWSPRSAADYLDKRMAWWLTWSNAQRDHGTSCVSCHTVLPYALSRPQLRVSLGEASMGDAERKLLENVVKSVSLWREVDQFYPD